MLRGLFDGRRRLSTLAVPVRAPIVTDRQRNTTVICCSIANERNFMTVVGSLQQSTKTTIEQVKSAGDGKSLSADATDDDQPMIKAPIDDAI
jgi:hypothetical protein